MRNQARRREGRHNPGRPEPRQLPKPFTGHLHQNAYMPRSTVEPVPYGNIYEKEHRHLTKSQYAALPPAIIEVSLAPYIECIDCHKKSRVPVLKHKYRQTRVPPEWATRLDGKPLWVEPVTVTEQQEGVNESD